MAAEIKEAHGVDAELIRGANGIYDIVVDGETIFSKHTEGRFPYDNEVLELLERRAATV